MASVSDLLKVPALKGIRVAAGEKGLGRRAEHVTVMEVPDIKRWLKGNDFLITSFYSVRKSEEEQCALIRDLSDTCCCIAVKTGKYVASLAEGVRKTADECGLPLLEIPFELPYIDIMINVMSVLMEEEGTSVILEKYIKDIIYENYSDETLIVERGRLFGIEADKNWFCALNVGVSPKEAPAGLRFLSKHLQQFLKDSPSVRGCYKLSLENGFLLLMETADKPALEILAGRLLEEEAERAMEASGLASVSCGLGSVEQGLSGIRGTYTASFRAKKTGALLFPGKNYYTWQEMQPFCTLEEVLSQRGARVFAGALSMVKNREILDTLTCYYECDGRMELVAERMHTHRNTIKYRLHRLQELTGLDLKNPKDNFKLYLAVLARKLHSAQRNCQNGQKNEEKV